MTREQAYAEYLTERITVVRRRLHQKTYIWYNVTDGNGVLHALGDEPWPTALPPQSVITGQILDAIQRGKISVPAWFSLQHDQYQNKLLLRARALKLKLALLNL